MRKSSEWVFENYANTKEFFLRNKGDGQLYRQSWGWVFNFLTSGGKIQGLDMDGKGIYHTVTETVQKRLQRGVYVTPDQMAKGPNARLRYKSYFM